ncbi:MAG: serine hydrolase [Oscillospiraceae bacterium]|nr:serine hydrolase [Oscillospiraceae bacterium]
MKKILSAVISAVIACTMLSMPVQAAEPTNLSDIGKEIEALAEENKDGYASFAAAVFSGNEVVYSEHFGYIDRENAIPADENAVYEWGSISKMCIWVSVMQLYEQGKIDLDADIQTYLPEGFLTKLQYDEPITMLHLMNHNAGWQETMAALEVEDEADIVPLEEALRKSEPAQVFRPGEITAYSNWGAALAAYIVECISGMDYADYLHEHVLQPLGMEQTAVSADYRDNAWVREQREKTKSYIIMNYPEMGMVTDESLGTAMSYILLYPAGSVTGTLADLTTFAQAFVDEDCPLFAKQETLDLMLSASDFYGESDIPKNCHGLWCTEYAVSTMGHGGNTNAGSANLVFDKESKTGVVVLANQQSEGTFCYGIPELVFGTFQDNPIYRNGEITEQNDISGNYVMSRGLFEGAAKISACLDYLPLAQGETPDSYTQAGIPALTRFSDHLYLIEGSNDFLYETATPDGKTVLEYSSMAYVQDDAVEGEFTAVMVFAAISVINLIILIAELIILLVKKQKMQRHNYVILTGQLAKLVIAAALIILLSCMVSPAVYTVLCISMGLCAVICLISGVLNGGMMFRKLKPSQHAWRGIYTLCCFFVSGFVVYFELFNFWA